MLTLKDYIYESMTCETPRSEERVDEVFGFSKKEKEAKVKKIENSIRSTISFTDFRFNYKFINETGVKPEDLVFKSKEEIPSQYNIAFYDGDEKSKSGNKLYKLYATEDFTVGDVKIKKGTWGGKVENLNGFTVGKDGKIRVWIYQGELLGKVVLGQNVYLEDSSIVSPNATFIIDNSSLYETYFNTKRTTRSWIKNSTLKDVTYYGKTVVDAEFKFVTISDSEIENCIVANSMIIDSELKNNTYTACFVKDSTLEYNSGTVNIVNSVITNSKSDGTFDKLLKKNTNDKLMRFVIIDNNKLLHTNSKGIVSKLITYEFEKDMLSD
nr:MAG TPA: Putative transferase, nesg, ydcK, Structural Genomics.38A [Caudoviricetes sp.]